MVEHAANTIHIFDQAVIRAPRRHRHRFIKADSVGCARCPVRFCFLQELRAFIAMAHMSQSLRVAETKFQGDAPIRFFIGNFGPTSEGVFCALTGAKTPTIAQVHKLAHPSTWSAEVLSAFSGTETQTAVNTWFAVQGLATLHKNTATKNTPLLVSLHTRRTTPTTKHSNPGSVAGAGAGDGAGAGAGARPAEFSGMPAVNFLDMMLECPICLQSAVKEGHCTTPCGHSFHKECLRVCLGQQQQCPTCRQKVNGPHACRDFSYMELVRSVLTQKAFEYDAMVVSPRHRRKAVHLELATALRGSIQHVRHGTATLGLAFFTGESEAFTVASVLCGLTPEPLITIGYRGIHVVDMDMKLVAAVSALNIAQVTSTGIVEPEQQLPVFRGQVELGTDIFCVTPDAVYAGVVTRTRDVALELPDGILPMSLAGAPLITFSGPRQAARVAGVCTGVLSTPGTKTHCSTVGTIGWLCGWMSGRHSKQVTPLKCGKTMICGTRYGSRCRKRQPANEETPTGQERAGHRASWWRPQ